MPDSAANTPQTPPVRDSSSHQPASDDVPDGRAPGLATTGAPTSAAAIPRPHPTLLRRGVLLCSESTAQRVVRVDPKTGICPKHNNGACALWYVPWPDAERAAKADEQLRADLAAVKDAEREVRP